MGTVERQREIHRRRHRRVKLAKLRTQYAKATSEADRAAILAKALRVSPLMLTEEFMAKLPATPASGK